MPLKIFITVFALLTVMNLQSQEVSFVGMSKSDVEAVMKKQYRSFSIDQSVVKKTFNYLKYVNSIQTITWIFYLNSNDVCRAAKKICDYTIYDAVLEELDEKYATVSSDQWEYKDKYGDTFVITLKEEEWYFTLRETRKEE